MDQVQLHKKYVGLTISNVYIDQIRHLNAGLLRSTFRFILLILILTLGRSDPIWGCPAQSLLRDPIGLAAARAVGVEMVQVFLRNCIESCMYSFSSQIKGGSAGIAPDLHLFAPIVC
jgi:hypothetical protein